jgi:uncharacterized protein YggT (Ycf19 family)
MKSSLPILTLLIVCLATWNGVSASVFLPYGVQSTRSVRSFASPLASKKMDRSSSSRAELRRVLRERRSTTSNAAMAIPGYGVAEQVFVGGFLNFLSIYNIVITARILLSWFPQAQGVALLQPVYAITDPYLNIFRGIIPPIFGLDLSPLLAFFLLNVVTKSTAAIGYEIPPHLQDKYQNKSVFGRSENKFSNFGKRKNNKKNLSMNP